VKIKIGDTGQRFAFYDQDEIVLGYNTTIKGVIPLI
jgi:hypothetical protein